MLRPKRGLQVHKRDFLGAFLLLATAAAFGDTMAVSPNGLYTATIDTASFATLSIAGPAGTRNFTVTSCCEFFFPPSTPLVNDFGQVVGYSEYGTASPLLYFALYSSGGFSGGVSAGN